MDGEGGLVEVGYPFSWTNVIVLVPRDKHHTVQHKGRNEVEKWAGTVG